MSTKISLVGNITDNFVVTTPRELLFDGDEPPFYERPAVSLEDAIEKASHLADAKIFKHEFVTVEGFSGLLTRVTEITQQHIAPS